MLRFSGEGQDASIHTGRALSLPLLTKDSLHTVLFHTHLHTHSSIVTGHIFWALTRTVSHVIWRAMKHG